MILQCKCKHSYQDFLYGKQQRVFNPMAKEENQYCCTVCEAIRFLAKAKGEINANKN